MCLGAYCKLRHDADVLQSLIALGCMRLYDLELLVCQLAALVQDLRRRADLADVVQQGDAVVLLHRRLIASQLPGQHGGVLGHA